MDFGVILGFSLIINDFHMFFIVFSMKSIDSEEPVLVIAVLAGVGRCCSGVAAVLVGTSGPLWGGVGEGMKKI